MRPLVLLPALLAFSLAAEAPPSADVLLQRAQATAQASHRAVLVAFHASWCSWCRRLEATLNRPAVKPIMDRHFVIQWLTVQERGPKQELDNPGAAALYQQWTAGAKAGIPFYLVLDAKGQMVSSSIRALKPGGKAGNMGYPGSPEEIQGFIALLKDGAPALTATETDTLERELNAAKP
jgi:thiol-disulfide isomerase/thioredoxin